MRTSPKDTKAVVLADIPPCSPGAPNPMILAGEHHLHLAYVVDDPDPDWDGSTSSRIGEESEGELCCLLTFEGHRWFTSYSHDDDQWDQHPLAKAGLEPSSLYEIAGSQSPFGGVRHFAIMFHDSMFECFARSVRHVVSEASVSELIRQARRA